MRITQAREEELPELADFAAVSQARPERIICYLAEDAGGLAAELAEVDEWPAVSAVARRDGAVVGWLVGEIDLEIGRVWWLGPFAVDGDWSEISDALLGFARSRLPEAVTQEEMAVDDRAGEMRMWAAGHGFGAETASVLLGLAEETMPSPANVRAATPDDTGTLAPLHDLLFPGTHLNGRQLVETADDRRLRLVTEADGEVVGYVAAERQPDGQGYIDFLGVAPDHRRRGLGAALIAAAVAALREIGVSRIHLTVRENNEAARALYRSLGFAEERILRPLRKGFSLD